MISPAARSWRMIRAIPRRASVVSAAALLGLAAASPVGAVPSFSTQTGMACDACHVGGFGPQLTELGRKFKMDGYGATSSWARASDKYWVPLSAMVVANYTHTNTDLSGPAADHFGANDNLAMQEASVFLAGRLAPGLGAFVQGTYSGVDRVVSMDNMDVRYAHEFTVDGKPVVLGVSLNNNPTVQDPWNSTPAWGFPYTSPDLAPAGNAGPLIAGGLEQQVLGVTPYVWLDNHVYLEFGGYRSLGASVLDFLNLDLGPRISGIAPYWRAAYSLRKGGQSFEVGVFGMAAHLRPDRTPGASDRYTDLGLDASYQWVKDPNHVLSLNSAYVHERQHLDASYPAGDAANASDTLDSFTLDASYSLDRRYGLTAGLFRTWGTADPGLYAPAPDVGSRIGDPAINGYRVQADFTPFGGAGSWGKPWVNARLGVQYTGYTKFNGAKTDYDGSGRKALDNNTLSAFLWTAF